METITVYGGGAAEFHVGDLSVLVRGSDGNKGAPDFAKDLAAHADALVHKDFQLGVFKRSLETSETEIADLKRQVAALRAELKDARGQGKPARLMGPGTVRFTGGELWLLNKRETGWSSFGFHLDGWDELFRRFDVVVTEHGEDEHGAFWIVVNSPERLALALSHRGEAK